MKYRRGSVFIFAILLVVAIIGLVAIVAIKKYGVLDTFQQESQTTASGDPQKEALENVSDSDEVSAIEADLESTNLESVNEELSQFDSDLESL